MIVALSLFLALQGIQVQQVDTAAAPRRVEGRVVLGLREGQKPIPGQWVVLHRVGHDRSGPLDSTRTSASGHYSFRYRPSGDTTALYFATTSYGGIVYPTSPFRGPFVSDDDAIITVFDTTSGPVAIGVSGRHLIIGAPNANGRRPIGEVYDLENDSTVTAIAKDSLSPIWTAHIPTSAVAFQINTNGELAAGAITRNGPNVGLFAPLSPGLRQLAFTYELPADAFPLELPVERPTGLFEVLVQEPTARVLGGKFREVPPQTAEGRVFRRFLGEDLQGNVVLTVDVPRMIGAERNKIYMAVGIALLTAMIVALFYAARRARPALAASMAATVPVPESRSAVLVRNLAALDEEFEHAPQGDNERRATYERDRAALKQQIADALAAERQPQ